MSREDTKTILKGMWWVKGYEHDKFTGILSYGTGHVPRLEIFPKEYDWDKQKVPDNSAIYGEVFEESSKVQAVTLLECRSENSIGRFDVGAYIYKQEFVFADCVAIGMHLDDDEIAQVQSPRKIYLTCPGLDEYGLRNYRPRDIWKENAPTGRGGVYRVDDLDKSIFTHPDPILIRTDIGSLKISLVRLENNTTTMHFSIEIALDEPMPKDQVNKLIYSQFLSFISIMAGQKDCIATHTIVIDSSLLTRDGSLSMSLNYGYVNRSANEREHDLRNTLVIGRHANIRMFATLFRKWRENFTYVEGLVFHYLEMIDQTSDLRTGLAPYKAFT